ncbi:hypothetical protein [Planococcus sp. CAU13]|uniref:hypothetical protein n=1 Tax=Planococcus sp. CAU13 TaxID=1541197 RepID=UPI00052FE526|nr:hypothetical protein [Planococcus sp. CAU13]
MIIAIKKEGPTILINEVEVERLTHTSSAKDHHKINFHQKEYNSYTDIEHKVNYEGIIDHYIIHHLMDRLFLSIENLLQNGYQYNPRARILIDHISILDTLNDLEPCMVEDILSPQCFSKVKNEYIQYKYLDSKIVLQQLDELALITFEVGNVRRTDLGRKLLVARDIPLPSPKKKKEVMGICKYCSTSTDLGVCIACRVRQTDMTLYEKSNRF